MSEVTSGSAPGQEADQATGPEERRWQQRSEDVASRSRQPAGARTRSGRREADAVRARLRFLVEAGGFLDASFDYETRLKRVAQLLLPDLADGCLISLLQEDGRLRLLTVAGAGPGEVPVLDTDLLPLQQRALRSNHGVLFRNPRPSEERNRGRAESGEPAARALPGAALAVPLRVRDRVFGVMTVWRNAPSQVYGREDAAFAEELARHAALVIENARLHGAVQEAVRQRDAFLSTAAHELKTPVASVKAWGQLLQYWLQPVEGSREAHGFQVLTEECERLTHLVEGLLEASRAEFSDLRLTRRPMDLAALARDITARLQTTTTEHRLRLDAPASLMVDADGQRLEQVIANLVTNAIKFSPGGGDIAITVRRDGGEALVSVRDQGIGIPPGRQRQVFERFYKAHEGTPHANYPGMGIGLYLSRHLVERHGGRIWFSSREGHGSTFSFTIPLGSARDATRHQAARGRARAAVEEPARTAGVQ